MKLVVAMALFLAAGGANGAEVFKCQRPDGKTEYSDKPCAPSAASTKVTVKPNSVQELDQSENRKKREAVDKRIKEAQAADVAENDRRARLQQAWVDDCQGYLDEANRQRAWLSSVSPAARQSAANEIAIQGRKYRDRGCEQIMPR